MIFGCIGSRKFIEFKGEPNSEERAVGCRTTSNLPEI